MELYGELGYHACFRASMKLKSLFRSHRGQFPLKTLDRVKCAGWLIQ